MGKNKYDIKLIINKLEKGEDLTIEEDRFYLKKIVKMSDEEIDIMFTITNNTDPNLIID